MTEISAIYGAITQSERVLPLQGRSRGFESHWLHQFGDSLSSGLSLHVEHRTTVSAEVGVQIPLPEPEFWCCSSVGSECLPVTEEVAGSSPVSTARKSYGEMDIISDCRSEVASSNLVRTARTNGSVA